MITDFNSQKSINSLEEVAKIGLWQANIDKKIILFSPFLINILNLKSEILTFEALYELFHPDNKEDMISGFGDIASFPSYYDSILILKTISDFQRFRFKTSNIEINDSGEVIAEGFMQCVDIYTKNTQRSTNDIEMGKLFRWQRSITQTLLGLLDKSTDSTVIQNMIDLIRTHFGSSYAYVFEFDSKREKLHCIYESSDIGKKPMKNVLQGISTEKGWIKELLDRKVSLRDNISDPLQEYGNVYGSPHIISSMAAPLVSQKGVWGCIKIDITDQKKKWSYLDKESFMAVTNVIGVSLALSKSEEDAIKNSQFLNGLYQNMPLGYFRLRIDIGDDGIVTDYEYLDVNPKFIEMIGISRENLVGKMHSEIGPIFVNKLDLQVLAGVAFEGKVVETRGKIRNNGRFYITTIYSPQRGDIVALFADINDTITATEALKKSEAELKKVYTNIPLGIEIYDKDGFMIEVNDQEIAIQAVKDKSVLLGLNLFEHPSLPKFAFDMLRQGKDVTFDVNIDFMKINRQYYGVDNMDKLRYLTIKCTVLYNTEGEVENYLLIVIDNTEIYETSARLHEFESAFNSVAEIAEVGFFRWNPLKNAYFNSDQWYRNMGFEHNNDVAFSFDKYSNMIHPDDVLILKTFINNAIAGKEKSIKYEFRVKDGNQWKWLRTSCFITEYNPANEIVQFIGINYNINELKKTEERLIEAKSKAEESDRLKSAFIANMSHEIRTPLNAIVGFSSILAETEEQEEKQQYMTIIEQNNRHLLNLISDILDLSKIEAGTIDISMSDIDVDGLCDQLVASIAIKAKEGMEIRFIPNQEHKGIVIHSDVNRITQVISNFMTNAMKFTTTGHIWLSYKVEDRFIEFSIEDTGLGMTPEQTKMVFERFVKFNEFIPGTGLGLSICKSIVEKLGGRIGVESQQGLGSRFWFTLPL